MAKKSKAPKNLTPDDQVLYDALPPQLKQIVDRETDPVKKSTTIKTLSATAPTTAAPTTAATAFTGSTPDAPTDSYFERAIGLETGRRVSTTSNIPIAGTAGRVGGAVTPYGATPGYAPRYYERDADLLSRYSRDQIADIQAQLKKSGLLGNNYRIGVPDSNTKKAWVDLLAEANNSNLDWQTALKTAIANPIGGGAKLPPKVSNPADIANVVRQVSRSVLGRGVDPELMNEIVQAFQRNQVRSQTGQLATKDGARVEPPGLEALAEKKIRKAAGPEADAYRFAQFAERIFGAAGSGAGVGEMGMP
jgi:hypothetical protein